MSLLRWDKVLIEDVGGANDANYLNPVTDGVEIQSEKTSTKIGQGQTSVDFYTEGFTIRIRDLTILDDARVLDGASNYAASDLCDITLVGAGGGATLKLSNVFLTGNRVFENNKVEAEVECTIDAETLQIAVS